MTGFHVITQNIVEEEKPNLYMSWVNLINFCNNLCVKIMATFIQ